MTTKTRQTEKARTAAHNALRDSLIEALGWEPEDRSSKESRYTSCYCATAVEMIRYLIEDYRKALTQS